MDPKELLQRTARELTELGQDTLDRRGIDLVDKLERVRAIAFADPRTGFLSRFRKRAGTHDFTFSQESHYRAAALLVLQLFPGYDCTTPIALRTAPRPHGGRIWRAMIDIRMDLPDGGLELLLGQKEVYESPFNGLTRFANSNGQFLPPTQSQIAACADAWAVLLLSQEDWSEAVKLANDVVGRSPLREDVKAAMATHSAELANVLLA